VFSDVILTAVESSLGMYVPLVVIPLRGVQARACCAEAVFGSVGHSAGSSVALEGCVKSSVSMGVALSL
jgi:hypothetical protein